MNLEQQDDRKTNTSNIQMTGEEVREMRTADLARWKRRLARKVQAQKFKDLSGLADERRYQVGANDAYDMVLKIIGAKWKNV
jgi:hypothetical protein